MQAFEYVWSCPGTWVFVAQTDSEWARASRVEQSRETFHSGTKSTGSISPLLIIHINPSTAPWWIRWTASKACLLWRCSMSCNYWFSKARGRQERMKTLWEEEMCCIHNVSRPLLRSRFRQFPRITSDSCICNCCDRCSSCVWLSLFLNSMLMCYETYPHCEFTDWNRRSTYPHHLLPTRSTQVKKLRRRKFKNNPFETTEMCVMERSCKSIRSSCWWSFIHSLCARSINPQHPQATDSQLWVKAVDEEDGARMKLIHEY